MQTMQLNLNGRAATAETEASALLVDLLRGSLGLTGTHQGCDTAQCGACTVLLDGEAVKSCSVLALQAQGRSVTTIEGLARPDGTLHAVQQAFILRHGLQCGFCTPGMILAATALLNENPAPTEAHIVHALEGNLCRCTGYVNIVAAVQLAASMLADASSKEAA